VQDSGRLQMAVRHLATNYDHITVALPTLIDSKRIILFVVGKQELAILREACSKTTVKGREDQDAKRTSTCRAGSRVTI
jgi:6-phosphogluconolactonase/glucosamine-6-phosphate isomerase/deaminase